jgi:hypothetical protein
VRPRAARRDLGRNGLNARNEGVRGSNPRVGFPGPDPAFLDRLTGGNNGATKPTESGLNEEAAGEAQTRISPSEPNVAEAAVAIS